MYLVVAVTTIVIVTLWSCFISGMGAVLRACQSQEGELIVSKRLSSVAAAIVQ